MITGAIVDITDDRDWNVRNFIDEDVEYYSIDYTSNMLEVRDQGSTPSCVGFAACGMKEFFDGIQLSPRFLYERVKQPGGGAFPRDAMKALLEIGVPDEECQPYVDGNIGEPCANVLVRAKPNRIKGYARIKTTDDMRKTLVKNGPFVLTLNVYDSWYKSSGIVTPNSKSRGLHLVTVVGYNSTTDMFKFKNSWGDWGDNGYGYISSLCLAQTMQDAWTIVDIPDDEEYGHIKKTMFQKFILWITDMMNKFLNLWR